MGDIKRLRVIETACTEGLLFLIASVSAYFFFYSTDLHTRNCYGQTISGVSAEHKLQITEFEVEGMENVNIGQRFKNWFMISMILTLSLLSFKLCSILSEKREIRPFFAIA